MTADRENDARIAEGMLPRPLCEGMTDRENDARIASEIMEWKRVQVEAEAWADVGNRWHADYCGTFNGTRTVVPFYSTDPGDSKKLREKLAERWDTNLGRANTHVFALWPKGAAKIEQPPAYVATGDTEERCVVACAIKLLDAKEGR